MTGRTERDLYEDSVCGRVQNQAALVVTAVCIDKHRVTEFRIKIDDFVAETVPHR